MFLRQKGTVCLWAPERGMRGRVRERNLRGQTPPAVPGGITSIVIIILCMPYEELFRASSKVTSIIRITTFWTPTSSGDFIEPDSHGPCHQKAYILKKKKKTSDTYTWFKDIPRIVRFSMKTEGGLVHYAFPSSPHSQTHLWTLSALNWLYFRFISVISDLILPLVDVSGFLGVFKSFLVFFLLLFHRMWNPSSSTRERSHAPSSGKEESLNSGPSRESLDVSCLNTTFWFSTMKIQF